MNLTRSLLFLLQKRCISSSACQNQKVKSHYESLGIEKSATQADVKSAYYELSKQYHPDRNQGCTVASNKFREVSAAYEVLGNVKTRRMYDKGMHVDCHNPITPDDPYGKFYKSREVRTRPPPPTGRTPIYDFDEWSRNHYGATFARSQDVKRRRFKEKQEREYLKQANKTENFFGVLVLLFGICVYLIGREQDYDKVTVIGGAPVVQPKKNGD